MTDINGVWIPPDEDGNVDHALRLAVENVVQRWKELWTRVENAGLEIPVADARRRIVEAQ